METRFAGDAVAPEEVPAVLPVGPASESAFLFTPALVAGPVDEASEIDGRDVIVVFASAVCNCAGAD